MFVMSNHIYQNCIHNIYRERRHRKAVLRFNLRAHLFTARHSALLLLIIYSMYFKVGSAEARYKKTTCVKTLVLLPVFPTNFSAEIFPQSGSYFGPSLEKLSFISRPPPQASEGIFLFPLAFG